MSNINFPSRVYFGAPLQLTPRATENFRHLIPRKERGPDITERSDEFIETYIQPYLTKDGHRTEFEQAKTFTSTMIEFYRNIYRGLKKGREEEVRVPPEEIIKLNDDARARSVYDLWPFYKLPKTPPLVYHRVDGRLIACYETHLRDGTMLHLSANARRVLLVVDNAPPYSLNALELRKKAAIGSQGPLPVVNKCLETHKETSRRLHQSDDGYFSFY